MKFDIEFQYTEKDVIPPRCRNPRDVRHDDGQFELVIAEVSGDDAPVAIIYRENAYRDKGYVDIERRYRWYDGRLWLPWWPAVGVGEVTLDDPGYLPSQAKSAIGYGHRTIEEARAALDEFATNHVFIDGLVHEPADEPMYSVNDYHYDGRHGSYVGVTDSYRHVPKNDLYRADQYHLAKAEVERIRAKMREAWGSAGPAEKDPDTENDSRLTVLMPEVLRRDPQAEAKADEIAADKLKIAKALLGAAEMVNQATKGLGTVIELTGNEDEFHRTLVQLGKIHAFLLQSPRIEEGVGG